MGHLVEEYGYASEGESFSIGDPNEVYLLFFFFFFFSLCIKIKAIVCCCYYDCYFFSP